MISGYWSSHFSWIIVMHLEWICVEILHWCYALWFITYHHASFSRCIISSSMFPVLIYVRLTSRLKRLDNFWPSWGTTWSPFVQIWGFIQLLAYNQTMTRSEICHSLRSFFNLQIDRMKQRTPTSSYNSAMCVISFQVSLLLKDSFIDSFPSRDRPFIKVTCFLVFCLLMSSEGLSIIKFGIVLKQSPAQLFITFRYCWISISKCN